MNLRRVLYLSEATTPLSRSELLALNFHAATNNAQRGITGLLLYSGGNFMQVIEGRPDRVGEIMRIVRADPRHLNIRTLVDEIAPERLFAQWSMGLLDTERLRPVDTDRLSMVMRAAQRDVRPSGPTIAGGLPSGLTRQHGQAALNLLRDFSQQLAA